MMKSLVYACLSTNVNASSHLLPDANLEKPSSLLLKSASPKFTPNGKRYKRKMDQQLALLQIERAVGAGSYRDYEPREKKREPIPADSSSNSEGSSEANWEKKLRETGQALASTAETKFQASGKHLLMLTIQWGIPLYLALFLVATRTVKLPFASSFLDNLLM